MLHLLLYIRDYYDTYVLLYIRNYLALFKNDQLPVILLIAILILSFLNGKLKFGVTSPSLYHAVVKQGSNAKQSDSNIMLFSRSERR